MTETRKKHTGSRLGRVPRGDVASTYQINVKLQPAEGVQVDALVVLDGYHTKEKGGKAAWVRDLILRELGERNG
jgi:hypothetical protein